MKRMLALILAVLLLAGCGTMGILPEKVELPPVQSPAPTPTPEPLRYWLEPGAQLPESLTAYASSRGIALEETDSSSEAGIAFLSFCPSSDHWDLSGEQLLAQGAQLLGSPLSADQRGIPVEMGQYGYLVNTEALSQMLDGADALADLQAATYAEWERFVKLASGWMAGAKVNPARLNGKDYPFAAAKGDAAKNLDDVFAVDCQQGFGESPLAPAFAAAAGSLSADDLIGPLNSVWNTFALETSHLATCGRGSTAITGIDAAAARQMFEQGKALLLRTELQPGQDYVPVKYSFDKTDLNTDSGWTLDSLSRSPIQSVALWGAVPENAPEAQIDQGLGYLLWLYTAPGSPLINQPSREIPVLKLSREQEALANTAVTQLLRTKQWSTDQRTQYVEAVLVAVAEITD